MRIQDPKQIKETIKVQRRTKMKKSIALLLTAALSVSVCVGCGQSNQESASPNEGNQNEAVVSEETPAETPAKEAEAPAVEASGSLVLYSPANDEEYFLVVDAFQDKYPDINIEVVQGGSGELKTRLESEQENPQADVMFGGLTFADATAYADLFAEYISANDAKLPESFSNTTGKVTMKSINIQVLLQNNELAEEAGVTIEGLEDLLDPALKGKIAMVDPSSSATAYRWLTCLLYVMGDGDPESDAAWTYIENLVQNLDGKLASSSSVAYKSVYEGEYVVGLTSESNGSAYLSDGFGDDVTVIYPVEGTTAASYGVGVIANCKNEENAKLFVDFIISDECQALYAESSIRPANTEFKSTSEYLPDIDTIKLVAEDYDVIGENQQAYLDRFNEIWAKYN